MLVRIRALAKRPVRASVFDRDSNQMLPGTQYDYDFQVMVGGHRHDIGIRVFVAQQGKQASVTSLSYSGPLSTEITGQIVGHKSSFYKPVPGPHNLLYSPLGITYLDHSQNPARVRSARIPYSSWQGKFPSYLVINGKPVGFTIFCYGSLVSNRNHALQGKATLVVPSSRPELLALAYLCEKFLPLMVDGRPFK